MLYQAHRGVSTEFPENTLPAFRAAWEQGYQVIELDPAFTRDGQCVVFHDAAVGRTCRGPGGEEIPNPPKVRDLTYEELLRLDAGVYMGPQFAGTKVPLLSQALAFAAETGLLVKPDNKFERFDPELKEAFFRVVEGSHARVAFTCAHPETAGYVAKRFPGAEIHYDGRVDGQVLHTLKFLLEDRPFTVWLPLPSPLTAWVKVPLATAELCQAVKRYASLGLWILETEDQLAQAIALGADIIETTGAIKPR